MTGIEVRLIGALEVVVDGATVDVPGERQRRVVARLALAKGRPVTHEALADAVWGDDLAPDHLGSSLRTYVGRVRASLDGHRDVIETIDGGYRLAGHAGTDIERFEDALRAARAAREAGDDADAAARYDEALAMWRGPVLSPWTGEAWAVGEAHRLDDLRRQAGEERAASLIAAGRASDAAAGLQAILAEDPHRESAARSLAVALHLGGRSGDALDVLADHRRLLLTDLGLDPSPEVSELERRILEHDPELAAPPRRAVRSYELGERLGEGAFSIVFRGRQTSLARDVAIKVLRGEFADDPAFIRQFEAEAKTVARLEHPAIVPLHDFWREPGAAYLVMRLLEGGTLAIQAAAGAVGDGPASRLVATIGGALEFAHARGVVHRDVKPANIFIDADGRYYLGDFGIALDAARAGSTSPSHGSPIFSPPERRHGEPGTERSDVYGLAMTACEALLGAQRFAALVEPDGELVARSPLAGLGDEVDPGLADVLVRATDPDPASRTPTVADFVRQFSSASAHVPSRPAPTGPGPLPCPYVGLSSFDEGDADRFFGRDHLVQALAGRLEAEGRVLVVGPSGSGKSSVVRAGLLPRLRAGAVPGSAGWLVASMTPGADPFGAVLSALRGVAVGSPESVADALRAGQVTVADAARRLLPEGLTLLLVVDQLEELFTHCADEEDRRRFMRSLVHDGASEVALVATCRADFYDSLLRLPEAAGFVRAATVPVTPLDADELAATVREPAARLGVECEPGLVAAVVADVRGEASPLPLLQYALTRLWAERGDGPLTAAGYREIGGVAGALVEQAERTFHRLSPAQQAAARSLFGRLVSPGSDRADTRRRIDIAEAEAVADGSAALDAFGGARLLTFNRAEDSRRPTVEVAHEALLTAWPRLAGWIEEDRETLRVHRQLGMAAQEWDRGGRDEADLLRGGRLEAAAALAEQLALTSDERAFLDASLAAREEAVETERRRLARLRGLLGAVAAVALVAIAAGLFAFDRQRQADQEAERAGEAAAVADAARTVAEDARLRSQAEVLATEDPSRALLLAVEAYRRSPSIDTERTLLRVLEAQRGVSRRVDLPPVERGEPCGVAWQTSGYDLPTGDGWPLYTDGLGVFLVDPTTGEAQEYGRRPDPCARALVSARGAPATFQTRDGVVLQGPDGGFVDLVETPFPVSMATSWPADPVVAVAVPVTGELHLFRRDGSPIASPVPADMRFHDMWLSRSGSWVIAFEAFATDLQPTRAQLFDARTAQPGWTVNLDSAIRWAAWSPDETSIAVATRQGDVTVLDVTDGSVLRSIAPTSGAADSAAFVDDDTLAIVSGAEVEFHDLGGDEPPRRFTVIGAEDIRALPDGRVVVIDTSASHLTLLSPDDAGTTTGRVPLRSGDLAVIMPGDLAGVVNVGEGISEVIDLTTGSRRPVLATVPGDTTIALLPVGGDEHVALTVRGRLVRLVDGEPAASVAFAGEGGWSIQEGTGFGPLIALRVVDQEAGTAAVGMVDLLDFEVLAGPFIDEGCGCGVGIIPAPDGSGLLVEEAGEITLRGATTVPLVALEPAGQVEYAVDIERNLLYRGTDEGVIHQIDLAAKTSTRLDNFGIRVAGIQVLPGERLLVQTAAGEVWILDVASGQRLGRLWVGGAGVSREPVVAEAGNVVYVVTETEIAGLAIDPEDWVAAACQLAGRQLTEDEWAEFIPGDDPYAPACPTT